MLHRAELPIVPQFLFLFRQHFIPEIRATLDEELIHKFINQSYEFNDQPFQFLQSLLGELSEEEINLTLFALAKIGEWTVVAELMAHVPLSHRFDGKHPELGKTLAHLLTEKWIEEPGVQSIIMKCFHQMRMHQTNLDEPDDAGFTPAVLCAYHSHLDKMHLLLQFDNDRDRAAKTIGSAMMKIITTWKEECVRGMRHLVQEEKKSITQKEVSATETKERTEQYHLLMNLATLMKNRYKALINFIITYPSYTISIQPNLAHAKNILEAVDYSIRKNRWDHVKIWLKVIESNHEVWLETFSLKEEKRLVGLVMGLRGQIIHLNKSRFDSFSCRYSGEAAEKIRPIVDIIQRMVKWIDKESLSYHLIQYSYYFTSAFLVADSNLRFCYLMQAMDYATAITKKKRSNILYVDMERVPIIIYWISEEYLRQGNTEMALESYHRSLELFKKMFDELFRIENPVDRDTAELKLCGEIIKLSHNVVKLWIEQKKQEQTMQFIMENILFILDRLKNGKYKTSGDRLAQLQESLKRMAVNVIVGCTVEIEYCNKLGLCVAEKYHQLGIQAVNCWITDIPGIVSSNLPNRNVITTVTAYAEIAEFYSSISQLEQSVRFALLSVEILTNSKLPLEYLASLDAYRYALSNLILYKNAYRSDIYTAMKFLKTILQLNMLTQYVKHSWAVNAVSMVSQGCNFVLSFASDPIYISMNNENKAIVDELVILAADRCHQALVYCREYLSNEKMRQEDLMRIAYRLIKFLKNQHPLLDLLPLYGREHGALSQSAFRLFKSNVVSPSLQIHGANNLVSLAMPANSH